MNKVIFLDRDGTINTEVNYLYKPSEFKFILGTVEALKIFHELGYKVIVITNQAGVARGYYSEIDVHILHKHIDSLLIEEDTNIDAYYYCPHHPEGIIGKYSFTCSCRKPNPDMISKAALDFNVDLVNSYIVGDKELDILAGKNAKIGHCILVRSGHIVNENDTSADKIYNKLLDFALDLKKLSNS